MTPKLLGRQTFAVGGGCGGENQGCALGASFSSVCEDLHSGEGCCGRMAWATYLEKHDFTEGPL